MEDTKQNCDMAFDKFLETDLFDEFEGSLICIVKKAFEAGYGYASYNEQ